jgi:hypothetical protein
MLSNYRIEYMPRLENRIGDRAPELLQVNTLMAIQSVKERVNIMSTISLKTLGHAVVATLLLFAAVACTSQPSAPVQTGVTGTQTFVNFGV